jgi:diguanylate cyclase (GGDEF)-like protein/PAS domain S-box-containing protein
MPAALSAKRRRASFPSRALHAMAQPRYQELCRRYPGPAAFVDGTGHVLDMNDTAPAILDVLDARPGGLSALATAIGSFARFETLELDTEQRRRIDLAILPLPEGVLLLGRDRALADNLSEALAESRGRYKDLVEISSDFAWETDAEGIFTFVSPDGALGYSARELIGQRAAEILPIAETEADHDFTGASPFVARGRVDEAACWLRRRGGEAALVAISAVPRLDAAGAWRGARGIARDLTEINEQETALAEAEHRDRLLAHVLRALVEIDEAKSGLAVALRACVRAYGALGGCLWRRADSGFVAAASIGEPVPQDLALDTLAPSGEAETALATRGDGRRLVIATAFRHRINGALALWRGAEEAPWPTGDVVLFGRLAAQFGLALAQLDGQQELERQARTDGLTGLLNRRAFLAEIELRLVGARRAVRPAALVYVDVDNFKPVNDRHGHAQGDQVLRAVADRLRRGARASDLVARLGGDEFALWLDDADLRGAEAKARDIVALREEFTELSASKELPLGFSVGVAVLDADVGETIAEIIERADAAMYIAKHGGKGRFAIAPPRSAA